MSGAAGGTRIPRSAVEQTVKDYTDNILSKIGGFKDAKLSGSFNRPEKEDFGDIDIIVTIETDKTKKEVKKAIADLFQSLPDNELPPLQNPKYKGRKYINHGEMVSNLYPISGIPGEFVQVDNIISLSKEEGEFKKTILDYPAEIQGLVLGLIKTPLLEEKPEDVFKRLNITNIPQAGEGQEYEFHIDTSGLTLRLVTYGDNYKILNSNIVWQSKNFEDVRKLLKDYDLNGTFEDIIPKVKSLKNERSKNRVKGYFKKSIKVGAAEKGTPKGDTKQKALDTVAQLEESYRANTRNSLRVEYLEEEEKTKIAIFPGAFKPPHKDHVNRIIAASEKVGNEGKVLVFISPSTRAKDGQEAISAEQSLRIFNILKDKNIIPSNVNIIISPEKSPVLAAYKEFEANKDQPYIAVFGKDDKARFKNIDEKLPNVEVNSFESAGIGNTSATDLRVALLNRDKSEVEKYIPAGITADEYINALGLAEEIKEEVIVEDTDAAADLWEPHAAMLDRMKNQPDLLKGLWKGLSKPSRRALVLYYRRKKTQTENVIPQNREKAAPYGSGYIPVDEGLWANINAKKKAGKKASHKNSNAYKDAKKAGDALEKTKGLEENKGEKKLRVFDFDDTLVHVDARIHITHKDGTKSGLTPAEYAVYVPKEGDTFNFSEFSSVIKKAKPLEDNIQDLIKSYNDPTEKTTILTARLLGYPVKKYLKDEFNIEPYVVGLGSSDPKDKSRWIEAQIKKGYNNIEFRDDSQKNVDAVAGLKDKYPETSIKSMLVENASYNKDNKVQYKIAKLTDHMKAKGMRIEPLPTVKFINGDSENARDFFGKTAYYDPASSTIVLYTEGRHPKDIVRSFAHEMIHHMQNLEGRLENITTTNTHEDDNLNDLEKEANLKGTMTFRNWTDSVNENIKNTKKDPFGLNAYAVELARELEEDLTADRIECSNCGWSWKKETGGKSPYLCHKCGHDNTPKLNEGTYDTITAQVSSDIFKAWKEQFDKDSTIKKASFEKSYNLLNKKGRSIVFDLEADLNFIETKESIYSPDGDADAGESETYDEEGNVEDTGMDGNISLYFQVDPRTLPRLWSTISMDLKDIVRHEIEHLTQSGYNVILSKELPDDQDLRFYIQQLGIMPASNYYLLDKEIPAMLQGLYYKAKKMKKPFKEVAEAYLDIFVNNGKIDAEAKVDILNRWRPEAKKLNLPSL